VQDENGMPALERLRPSDAAALLVLPAVPDDHPALSGRAFEGVVRERVVLDLHGEALRARIERRALRHGPRAHRAADLQAKVEVTRRRGVLLDDEYARAHAADGELLVTLDGHRFIGDARDRGAARSVLEEPEQRVDRRRRSLRVDGDRAVVGVAHPAEHAQLSGATAGALAKADAVDGPCDGRANGSRSGEREVGQRS